MSTPRPRRSNSPRRRRPLSRLDSMNDWPPQPGFTAMTITWSTWSSTSSTALRGVFGLRATPALAPRGLANSSVRCRGRVASRRREGGGGQEGRVRGVGGVVAGGGGGRLLHLLRYAAEVGGEDGRGDLYGHGALSLRIPRAGAARPAPAPPRPPAG